MLYFIKRHKDEAMLVAGVGLLISAACWHGLLDQGTFDWDLDRTTGFGFWLSRNGLGVMFVLFILSGISGTMFLICGAWQIIRHSETDAIPQSDNRSPCGWRLNDKDA